MKKLLGIMVLGLLLTGCATPPAAYIPPAPDLIKGSDRYSCKYLNSKYNYKIKYYFWDIEFNKGLILHYATIYKKYNSETFQIKSDNNDEIIFVSKDKKRLLNFSRSSGIIKSDGKAFAKCFHLEGPNYKVTKKTTISSSNSSTKKPIKTKGSSGTAFFISNNYLITNHHVIKGCNNNSKIIYQTKEINTQLIAKDKFLDLALLKVDVDNDTYISISKRAPSKLQRIIAAGYPFGKYLSDDMKFTSGIVSSLKGLGDDSTRLQIDAALNRGNSGGPIVDENTGELVAVAVAGLRKDKTEAVNFGIKAASVKNFLQSNQIDTTLLKKRYSRAGVASLLESTTMYTFCN
jgi:S1-C subfamily serine protease